MDRHDIPRLIGDLFQEGTVVSVDLAARTARVQVGDIETGDLPWAVARVGSLKIWAPPAEGEPVLIFLPEGDIERAIIAFSLFSSDHAPAGNTASLFQLEFADGALLSYDHDSHQLGVKLPPAGAIRLEAPAGVTIDGKLVVTDDVEVQGKVTADEDVVGGGKSLKDHIHTQVQTGNGVSGKPQ